MRKHYGQQIFLNKVKVHILPLFYCSWWLTYCHTPYSVLMYELSQFSMNSCLRNFLLQMVTHLLIVIFHISAIFQRNVSANRRGKEVMKICMNATWNMVALSSSQWNRWLKYLRNIMDTMNLFVLSNLSIWEQNITFESIFLQPTHCNDMLIFV
jgi:hypothetical protein